MGEESAIRLTFFLGVFLLVALAEHAWPRRRLTVLKGQRWLNNLFIVITDTLVVRLMIPIMPVALAELARVQGWGLLNLVHFPHSLKIILTIFAFDLIIYLQHRAFHRVVLFWQFHRMHHTDLDLDVSSGTRFHPFEIMLSLAIKLAAVVLLGVSPLAVLLFEIILNATSMFNHANLRLPLTMDAWLRLFVVTPDMHRVHHSVNPRETNSNFGFNLPWWDRLFGTYRAQPGAGHDRMLIGLQEWRDLRHLGLWPLLRLPFIHPPLRRTP